MCTMGTVMLQIWSSLPQMKTLACIVFGAVHSWVFSCREQIPQCNISCGMTRFFTVSTNSAISFSTEESLIHLLLSIISLRSYTRQLFDSFLDDSVLFTFYIYAVEVFVAVTKSQCPDVSLVRTIESIIPAVALDYSWWCEVCFIFLNVIFNFAGITRYDFYF